MQNNNIQQPNSDPSADNGTKPPVRRSAAKPKKVHWSKLVNAESADGTWDWFNPTNESRMKLVKFVDDKPVSEVDFSEEEWIDLVKLIRRIS